MRDSIGSAFGLAKPFLEILLPDSTCKLLADAVVRRPLDGMFIIGKQKFGTQLTERGNKTYFF